MLATCVEKKLIFPEGRMMIHLSVSFPTGSILPTLKARVPSGLKRGLSGLLCISRGGWKW